MIWGQWSGDLEITSGEAAGKHADATLNIDFDRPRGAVLNGALRSGKLQSGARGVAIELHAIHGDAEAKALHWKGAVVSVFDEAFNVQTPDKQTEAD